MVDGHCVAPAPLGAHTHTHTLPPHTHTYPPSPTHTPGQGWWMGCGRQQGPACSRFKNVMMTIAFLKRLFSTLPTLATDLGLEPEPWWMDIATHLPPYAHTAITVCRQVVGG